MRKALVAFALLAAAAPAAPQAQKPATEPEKSPASSPAATAPHLNLKLDQPARFYTSETPREDGKGAAANLPSLGGNAATLERPPAPGPERAASPYPKDWQTGR